MLGNMARPIRLLTITPEQRRELRATINRPTAAVRENRRAWIILNRANGLSQTQTAAKVGVARPVVVKWEQRFRKTGLAGLAESKGRGRKPWIDPKVREKIVVHATQPPPNRSRWSVRSMAKSAGVSKATVQRIWSANDIKPHVIRTFKLSHDKNFEVKFWDVIGLYLNPPDHALVLCCDEKSQCQALERTQPSLPLKGGIPAHGRMITSGTGRSPCLRLYRIWMARFSARQRLSTLTGNGWLSSRSWMRRRRES